MSVLQDAAKRFVLELAQNSNRGVAGSCVRSIPINYSNKQPVNTQYCVGD